MAKPQQAALVFEDDEESKKLFERLQLERPLAFFDLETTGLDMANDRIVQFAFIKLNRDRTTEEWSALVNPGVPIPAEASRVHKITDDMVADKPSFKDFAPLVAEFLTGCDLAGFNAAAFDLPFLQAEMERSGFPLSLAEVRVLDAQVIFHKNEPRNLSAAYQFYCKKELTGAHDALADVRATVEVLDAQLKKYRDLPTAMDALYKYCAPRESRFVTPDRKFQWRNGEAVLTFGKHRGKSLQWLVENERDYLLWMKNGDFSDETKALIAAALEGNFPSQKVEQDE